MALWNTDVLPSGPPSNSSATSPNQPSVYNATVISQNCFHRCEWALLLEHKVQRHCTAAEQERTFFFIPGSLTVHSIYKKNTCTSTILSVFCQQYNIRSLPPPNIKQAMGSNQLSRNTRKHPFSTHESSLILVFLFSSPKGIVSHRPRFWGTERHVPQASAHYWMDSPRFR